MRTHAVLLSVHAFFIACVLHNVDSNGKNNVGTTRTILMMMIHASTAITVIPVTMTMLILIIIFIIIITYQHHHVNVRTVVAPVLCSTHSCVGAYAAI